MSKNFINVLGLFVAVVFGMSGCGGGGGGSGTPAPITPGNVSTPTVSGTASEGALITGKAVRLKDANGTSAIDGTTNATTGIYTIDVTGLTAPFFVTVTGTNGTYVSLAQSTGTANINPITTTIVALAAGNADVLSLFTSLTPAQLSTINTNYTAKSELLSTSLQTALPPGVKAEDYFTGTITAGKGIDAIFDTYQIAVHPTAGITIKTKDANATTVLTIPASTVAANTTQPLPTIFAPTTPIQTPIAYKTYTFEGSISELVFDGGGIIASQGYKVGDHVSAKFTVDFLGQGKMTLNSGEIVIPKDPQMTNDVHSYFYANLMSGTRMPELNGGMNNGPNDVKLYEIGYNEGSPMGNTGVLKAGNGDSSLVVMKESQLDANVQNWVTGEHFKGILSSCSEQNCSLVWADMVLTAIQEESF